MTWVTIPWCKCHVLLTHTYTEYLEWYQWEFSPDCLLEVCQTVSAPWHVQLLVQWTLVQLLTSRMLKKHWNVKNEQSEDCSLISTLTRTDLKSFLTSWLFMMTPLLRLAWLQSSVPPKITLMNRLFERWNRLPQPVSNSNLHSCMRNEQWIFYDNLSVFGQIKKYLNKENYLKVFSSNSRKLSFHNYLVCEFTYAGIQR